MTVVNSATSQSKAGWVNIINVTSATASGDVMIQHSVRIGGTGQMLNSNYTDQTGGLVTINVLSSTTNGTFYHDVTLFRFSGVVASGSLIATINVGTPSAMANSRYLIRPASGNTIDLYDSAESAFSSTTTPTVSSTKVITTGDLVIGSIGTNGPDGDTWTVDADTSGGSWTSTKGTSGTNVALNIGTTGGSATSNVSLRQQYKILTSDASQTFNPTLGTARNMKASIYSLYEYVPGPSTWNQLDPMGMMGFFGN